MPEHNSPGLIEGLNNLVGGGLTAFISALTGRLMWHALEVRARRRPVLCATLIWELPLAFGMALIGDGLGSYLELNRDVTIGLIAMLSYLGPRGVGAMLERWLNGGKANGKEPHNDQ